jgi:hypothetical protein
MTLVTKAHQVIQAIGLFVIGEATETADMMNVQFFTEFLFCNAALATGVVVTPARCPALLSPVLSIVGRIAASPVGMIFTAWRMNFLPLSKTSKGTEATMRSLRSSCVFLAALFARGLVGGRLPFGDVRNGILGRTFFAAILAGPRLVVSELFAALRAIGCHFGVRKVKTGATFYRAGIDGPALVEGELGSAYGAIFGYVALWLAGCAGVALHGTKHLRWILAAKFLSASWAGKHYLLTSTPTGCRAKDTVLVNIRNEFFSTVLAWFGDFASHIKSLLLVLTGSLSKAHGYQQEGIRTVTESI